MREAKPCYRKSNDSWYVEVGGKQVRLAKGKANRPEAVREFHRLMAGTAPTKPSRLSVDQVCDLFLRHSECQHEADTFKWHRRYLQEFCDRFGRLKAADLIPFHLTTWLDAHPNWKASRRHATAVVKRAFAWAAGQQLLDVLIKGATMGRSPDNEADPSVAFRERMRYLLEYRWRGNQREMARAIGVSQGLISKVLSGTQGPGRRLLAALEAYPGISSEWLRKGTGQPLPNPEQGSLPIASGVLPGLPLEHPHLLTGSRHPVSDAMAKPSRYWLPVPVTSRLLKAERYQLRAGDLLLMEASQAWTRRPDLADGRICGVRVVGGPAVEYQLGRVGQHSDGLVVDFGPPSPAGSGPGFPVGSPARPGGDDIPRPSTERRPGRTIRYPEDEERKARERENAAPAFRTQVGDEGSCSPDDIVAVSIYMARPDPKFV